MGRRDLDYLVGCTVIVHAIALPTGIVRGIVETADGELVKLATPEEQQVTDGPFVTIVPWDRIDAIEVTAYPEPPVWNPEGHELSGDDATDR